MFQLSNNLIWCGIVIEILFTSCIGFKIYDFHDVCENTLDDEAGELRFDAQKLPSYSFDSKCSVTVQPRSNSLPQPIQVSFYFTKFDLSGPCEDMSVSVKEGGSIFQKPVEGLPEHICGRNISLEKASRIFNTNTDKFTVTFERKPSATYLKGNFTIKFIAFYSGEREGSGVYNCSKGHCISSTYECSTHINSCADNGEHMQNCDLLKALTELVNAIAKIIRDYSWIILVLIGLCVLKCFWKRCKEKFDCNCSHCCDYISSCCDSLSECGECITVCCSESVHKCRDAVRRSSDTSIRRDSVEHQDVQEFPRLQPLRARENARETTNDANAEVSPEFIRLDSLNEYFPSDDERTPYSPNSPEAPPPSYDEVMASSNAKPCAPSYEEVIANRHKYETDI